MRVLFRQFSLDGAGASPNQLLMHYAWRTPRLADARRRRLRTRRSLKLLAIAETQNQSRGSTIRHAS